MIFLMRRISDICDVIDNNRNAVVLFKGKKK